MQILPFRPDGVIFDCDSTLSTVEGIDELAIQSGHGEEIARMTQRAMDGELPLEAIYSQRLDLIRPDKAALDTLAQRYIEHLTDGARATVAALHQQHIPLAIISGGLRPAILPLARELGIDAANVFAVELAFDDAGHYQDVLPSPLTTAQGKHPVAAAWCRAHNLQRTVLIGDGASDVAALGAVKAVIGYGGIIARDNVRRSASYFYSERDLRGLLPLMGFAAPKP